MVDADFNFKMPKIEMTEQSEDGKYGRFVVEPLERGYGLTLGNSLRRIMLSSLVGTAVSSIKIEAFFMNSAQFLVLRKMLLR